LFILGILFVVVNWRDLFPGILICRRMIELTMLHGNIYQIQQQLLGKFGLRTNEPSYQYYFKQFVFSRGSVEASGMAQAGPIKQAR
jgi:hypothetical protein